MKALALLVVFTSLLALTAGQAAARTSKPVKTVTVVMRDPGCHWFAADGKFLRTLRVSGPVKLANLDMAALVVAGPSGVLHAPVGKQVTLAPGVYHITMVRQAPDDNRLKLVVT
jgi:hypothetical protein